MDLSTTTATITSPVPFTPQEHFDIVDQHNNRIFKLVPRNVVHSKGIWHRSVGVLLINDKQELLVQQRSASKNIWPNAWDISVAEHLQPGESYLDAAKRGVSEELGISLEPKDFIRVAGPHKSITEIESYIDKEWAELYRVSLPDHLVKNIQFCDGEVQNTLWIPLKDCFNGIQHTRQTIQALLPNRSLEQESPSSMALTTTWLDKELKLFSQYLTNLDAKLNPDTEKHFPQ